MGDGTCPAHGTITQSLSAIDSKMSRIENKLDNFTDRLGDGAIRFENHEGRIKACEARNADAQGKGMTWYKAAVDIIKMLIVAGISVMIGMKL